MIKIIAVGKIKKSYLEEGIKFYQKQIPQKTEIIEIEDGKDIYSLKQEGTKILDKIDKKDFVVALAINGNELSSEELASKIELWLSKGSNIVFVIGGSHGLSQEVIERADYQLSFSKMTFPHQLMRLILMEQLFRAFSILANHPYHK